MRILTTPTTRNSKTGNVPTITVGGTREEAYQSCADSGCPKLTDNTCYAWNGTPLFAAISRWKSRAKRVATDTTHELRRLDDRSARARMVRLADIGDPGALHVAIRDQIVAAVRGRGLSLIGYTHAWRKATDWMGQIMASTDTLAEADEAVAMGWRATTIVPWDHTGHRFDTPAGNRAVVCPAQVSKKVVCNTCRLCDGSKPGPVIAFLDHSKKALAAQRRG